MRIIDAIRSIFFNVIFVCWSLLFLGLAVAPLCFLKSEKPVRHGVNAYCHSILWLARWVMGIRHEYRGLENLPKKGGLILAAAHQSNMDPMLAYCARGDVTALAKKELFAIPFVGSILRKMQVVRIDRKAKNAHKDMDDVARQVMELERPLIVYPQATRVPIGQVKKLKAGAYYLHLDTGLPVIPVATNTGLFWTKGFWHRSGTVVFAIGAALPDNLTKKAFMEHLEDYVVNQSDKLVVEAGYENLLSAQNSK